MRRNQQHQQTKTMETCIPFFLLNKTTPTVAAPTVAAPTTAPTTTTASMTAPTTAPQPQPTVTAVTVMTT